MHFIIGGGEEVNLDDDVPSQSQQSKLEFCTPEEEFTKPSSIPSSPPAELRPSEPPKPQARTSKNASKSAEDVRNFSNKLGLTLYKFYYNFKSFLHNRKCLYTIVIMQKKLILHYRFNLLIASNIHNYSLLCMYH